MAKTEFKDNTIQVKEAMKNNVVAVLYECAGEIESQTKRNSRVKTGKTKSSFRHVVDEDKLKAIIGSSDENAIWEELGTGEYALNGNGRKGGWKYVDEDGNGHFTRGKKPSRAMWKAYTALKSKIINRIQNSLKGL